MPRANNVLCLVAVTPPKSRIVFGGIVFWGRGKLFEFSAVGVFCPVPCTCLLVLFALAYLFALCVTLDIAELQEELQPEITGRR